MQLQEYGEGEENYSRPPFRLQTRSKKPSNIYIFCDFADFTSGQCENWAIWEKLVLLDVSLAAICCGMVLPVPVRSSVYAF